MLFRPITPDEVDRAAAYTVEDPVGWIAEERFRTELGQRQYRPEWTWVAEDDGEILARALWWGRRHSQHPIALDCLDVNSSVDDRARVGTELIAAGQRAFRRQGAKDVPQYNISLPNRWRDSPEIAAAVAWRTAAAHRAWLTEEVERLLYEWTPEPRVPERTGRLVFSPEPDDETFLAVFRRIAIGSLDVATQRELAALGPERQAREDLGFYLSCPGKREWWRVAHTPDGELVGMAIPSATAYNPNVGYLGVVPELRGHGYIDELLAEITRFHAGRDAQRITATTDTVNTPMALAFERAGYRNIETRMVFGAPVPATIG
ncbi:MAG TPA: GNAT family N-acetyltransferase [Dermatophilaceae bacterium]|nr:GNAT family N-acetyltransferase [Dermatophilaceae bacterium]